MIMMRPLEDAEHLRGGAGARNNYKRLNIYSIIIINIIIVIIIIIIIIYIYIYIYIITVTCT